MLSEGQRRELDGIETAAKRVAEHAEQAARTAYDEMAMLATLVAELARVVRELEARGHQPLTDAEKAGPRQSEG